MGTSALARTLCRYGFYVLFNLLNKNMYLGIENCCWFCSLHYDWLLVLIFLSQLLNGPIYNTIPNHKENKYYYYRVKKKIIIEEKKIHYYIILHFFCVHPPPSNSLSVYYIYNII